MPGSFDLDNYLPPLCGPAMPIAVYYFDPKAEDPFFLLPNVVCLRIDYHEGPEPPVARLRYIFDDNLDRFFGWPSRVDEVWPLAAQGDYVVRQDDRLVVASVNPDGAPIFLFDGFAQVPQADLTPESEGANFIALGVAARAWDDVIHTRVQRDSDTPDDTSGDSDFEIQAPCRFNPADQGAGSLGGFLSNSTHDSIYTNPDGSDNSQGDEENDQPEDGGGGDVGYPVFIDPLLTERELEEQADEETAPTLVAPWYVSDAILYLLVQPSPADDFVLWPDGKTVVKLLESYAPPDGTTTFDLKTAVPADCVIRDYDATGKTLPEAMADLLGYAGFLMTWDIGADGDGMPQTYLRFYRRDGAATGAPKSIYLDPPGASLAAGSRSNVTQLHLARDVGQIVNAWRAETSPKQVEITVLLAPLFDPDPADASSSAGQSGGRNKFKAANLTDADAKTRRKYRWYGADECGDGHWNMVKGEKSVQPLDLSPVFPNTGANTKSYSTRYRPGTDVVIARDTNGKPLRAVLEYFSPDDNTYSSEPSIQKEQGADGWLTIKNGWKLLGDRLGIEVDVSDPEEWATGQPKLPKIAGISQVALAGQAAGGSVPANHKPFTLRLTTTIYADERIDAKATKRAASPTQFSRWRSADAADHFRHCSISLGSINYLRAGGDGKKPVVIRDDTKKAIVHAKQLQSTFEMPSLAGSVTIRGINLGYEVGDRIDKIAGREISLRTNIGASRGEAPTFPWIVGVSWTFEGERQETHLQLSDRRGVVRNSW